MKVLIIEDEQVAALRLQKLLKEIEPDIIILDILDSIESSIKWLKTNDDADLIFFDIYLADGLSFEIFKNTEIKCPVIFTTAYDQYAVQAFKVNSIDYLLKPIKIDELNNSLIKYKKFYINNKIDYSNLLELLKKPIKEYQKRFIVHTRDKIKFIETSDISYFLSEDKIVFLITKNNEKYSIDYTLEKLENNLNPEVFFRVNRKFIISLNYISNMFNYSKSRIKIEMNPICDQEIIVSYERSADFKLWLNK